MVPVVAVELGMPLSIVLSVNSNTASRYKVKVIPTSPVVLSVVYMLIKYATGDVVVKETEIGFAIGEVVGLATAV